jgi:hypothetical protein
MANKQTPQPVEAEAKVEASPEPSAPINFAEPVSAADLVAGVSEDPDKAVPVISADQLAALQAQAANDDVKRDFTLKVLAARAKNDVPEPVPPPLAPRVAEQTRAEIEAGRKMNAHHAALAVHRPAPVPDKNSTPVFRPGDYVPDQKKGQGYTQPRTM